ncbi:MAG: hypothetical protein AB7O67_16515 [Vicinamibacterales bacterium]
MATDFPFITGPRQAHGARTPDEYLAIQRAYLARLSASGRAPHAEPFEAGTADAYVSAGKWKVRCPCGDAPSASPEWDLACCLGCGAIYRSIAWPENRAAIENLLMVRPRMARHWRPGVSVSALRDENATHGAGR